MITINVLSDYLKFNRFFGVNGAMIAAKRQAESIKRYVNLKINGNNTECDIVHSHGCMPYTLFKILNAKRLGKPIVISAHQTHHDVEGTVFLSKYLARIIKYYLKIYYNLGDIIICPTNNSRDIIKKEMKIDKPLEIISNGIDTLRFSYSKKSRYAFRKKYKLDKVTVLSVGMPTQRKGFYDFINYANKIKNAKFLWVGKKTFPLLQRNIKINKDNIVMPGYIEDIVAAYSASDIFCFPSYYEGEGLVILEAMSCGLPVIARNLPVYKGRLVDGKNALLANNNKEFIKYLNYLIDNPQERRRLGKNGLKTVKNLDIKISAKRHYDIYKKLIEKKNKNLITK